MKHRRLRDAIAAIALVRIRSFSLQLRVWSSGCWNWCRTNYFPVVFVQQHSNGNRMSVKALLLSTHWLRSFFHIFFSPKRRKWERERASVGDIMYHVGEREHIQLEENVWNGTCKTAEEKWMNQTKKRRRLVWSIEIRTKENHMKGFH